MWNQLADVGALYPGVGWEIPLVVVVVATWLAWTVWQIRHENAEYEQQVRGLRDPSPESAKERS